MPASPTTCTAYRWLDDESGLVAWLVSLPDGSIASGYRRSEAEANERIGFWCRVFHSPLAYLFPHHPNKEVRRAS